MISEMVEEMVQTIDDCFVQTEVARGEVKEVAKNIVQTMNDKPKNDTELNVNRQSGSSNHLDQKSLNNIVDRKSRKNYPKIIN